MKCQVATIAVPLNSAPTKFCDNEGVIKHKGAWMCDYHWDEIHPDGTCDCVWVQDIADAHVFDNRLEK